MSSLLTLARGALFAAAVACAPLAAPIAAQANTAIQFLGTGTTFTGFSTDETIGWAFIANEDLRVTRLGWFVTAPSLNADHEVGIWDTSGALLVSATVLAPGPASPDGFRYVATPFAPVILTAGRSYLIGGRDRNTDGDSYITSLTSLVTDPAITFRGALRSADGSGFAFPNLFSNGVRGRFGPNFQFDVVPRAPMGGAVPEPATWAMMILGFGAAGVVLRQRRRQDAATGVAA